MTTEVYSCKLGQPLREGRLEHAPHITDKAQTEADAKRCCQKDSGLHRIAYYEVHEDGRFRNFHTYTNPNARADQPKAPRPSHAPPPPSPRLQASGSACSGDSVGNDGLQTITSLSVWGSAIFPSRNGDRTRIATAESVRLGPLSASVLACADGPPQGDTPPRDA